MKKQISKISLHLLLWVLIAISDTLSEVLNGSYAFGPVFIKSLAGQCLNAALFYTTAFFLFPRSKPWSFLYSILLVALAPFLSYLVFMTVYHLLLGVEFMPYGWDLYLYYLSNGILFVVAGYLFGSARKALDLEKKQSEMERQHALAEAQFLRSKLNPHFLFNALNTLLSLSVNKQKQLPETLLRLAGILRYNLENRERFLVSVHDEIGPLQDYLFVQRQRLLANFPFAVHINAQNPDFEIPVFSLINLAENCFKHGDLSKQGYIQINLRSGAGYFYFSTRNKKNRSKTESGSQLGLESLKKQLDLNYNGHYRMKRIEQESEFQIQILIWS